MITSTPTTKNEIFAFIAALVLQLLSRKAIFTNRKDNGSYQKVGLFLTGKLHGQILRVNYCKIMSSWNAKL